MSPRPVYSWPTSAATLVPGTVVIDHSTVSVDTARLTATVKNGLLTVTLPPAVEGALSPPAALGEPRRMVLIVRRGLDLVPEVGALGRVLHELQPRDA